MTEPVTCATATGLVADDTIGDLLTHPAFAGFSRLLLPSDDCTYDGRMRLQSIGSLLPYHSHVDPAEVVGALNRIIEDVHNGTTVFYDVYTDEERQQQPTKCSTGLFFFRGRPGAPFAVISPGGGFSYVGSVHKGFPYAIAISNRGYNAFVLRYRVGSGAALATRDLAAAISYIFRNAATLGVGTEGYSLWGSSAGARMAAAIGSHGVASFGGDNLPKPSAVVMAYTGHSDHSADEPPTFVVVGERDGIAPPSVMERRVAALRRSGAEVEFHRYRDVGHGFGAGIGTTAEGWLDLAIEFWEKVMPAHAERLARRNGVPEMSTGRMTVLVVGATGSIGRLVVEEAGKRGHAVRALARDARQAARLFPGVEVVAGDLTAPDTLTQAVDGVDAIVFTHGSDGGGKVGAEQIDYGGVRNVIAALGGRLVRIALMTAIGVTDRDGDYNRQTEAHDWKRRGERLVRVTGLPYTIVRPGWFDYNKADEHHLVLLQGDRRHAGNPSDGVVARRQIAEVLVASLTSTEALRKTFELVATRGAAQHDLDAVFAELDADAPGAVDAVRDLQNMPPTEEPERVRRDLAAAVARVSALEARKLIA